MTGQCNQAISEQGSLIKLPNIHCCDFGHFCNAYNRALTLCVCVRAKCKGENTSRDLGEILQEILVIVNGEDYK